MRALTLVNEETLRTTTDYTSALSNANIAKKSDLVVFPGTLLFFSLCYYIKIVFRGMQF